MGDAAFNGLGTSSAPSTGPTTNPVSVAQGGTGQTTVNAAINALLALGLSQTTIFALLDNLTATAPIARVLRHLTSGTAAAGFGIGEAVDLQSAGGNTRRVMTDVTTLTTPTDAAETATRVITTMVAGSTASNAPTVSVGTTADFNGMNVNSVTNATAGAPHITVGPASNKMGMYKSGGFLCFGVSGTQVAIASTGGFQFQTPTQFTTRLLQVQGVSVASATTITLGSDGNVFTITGTTQITNITVTGWNSGSRITLILPSGIVITHTAAATSGTIFLRAAANLTTAKVYTLDLVYDGTQWRQPD